MRIEKTETEQTEQKKKGASKGIHIMLDCRGCNNNIDDFKAVYEFLKQTPEEIGMSIMRPPVVFIHDAKHEKNRGISGFTLLSESHISFHAYPERDSSTFIDVFSCSRFSVGKVIALVKEWFSPAKITKWVIDRGVNSKDKRK